MKKLLELLKPYQIHRVYADESYAYRKYIGHDRVNVHGLNAWLARIPRKDKTTLVLVDAQSVKNTDTAEEKRS